MAATDSAYITKFAEVLTQKIGLNSESVGRQTLQHAVHQRMSSLKMQDFSKYFTRLQTDPVEWGEFIEEIIVPESWFFREGSPFECVRLFAQQALKQDSARAKLRFLSVPCSRGEEPYSLSMTLLDAGLIPNQFEIVACDLSERSLSIARRGRYRAISFREEDEVSKRLTAQHFQQHNKEWELSFDVRSMVTFRQANLVASDFLRDESAFDMILCRNLMIYLTEDARRIAFANLKRLLAPSGLLYFGHSECRVGTQAGLNSWNKRFPAAFALSTPSTDWSTSPQTPVVSPLPYEPSRTTPKIEQAWSQRKVETPVLGSASVSASSVVTTSMLKQIDNQQAAELTQARDLANRGQLQAAETICQKLQQSNAYDSDLLCLQGVIQQAYGNLPLAESYYHKSLFVAPNHVESLTHLMLLHQLRGEHEQTMNYQRRLKLSKSQGS